MTEQEKRMSIIAKLIVNYREALISAAPANGQIIWDKKTNRHVYLAKYSMKEVEHITEKVKIINELEKTLSEYARNQTQEEEKVDVDTTGVVGESDSR